VQVQKDRTAVMTHYTEDDLILYHYGESKRSDRIEQHLQACDSCRSIYRDISATLTMVGDLEVPARDERYGLEVWQRIRHDLPPRVATWELWWYRPAVMAAAAMLVIAAFVAGRFTVPATQSPAPTAEAVPAQSLGELRAELREMRQMLTLSLLQQQSATERLRGVSGSAQIDQPGAEVIRALLDALIHDSNVNVRLASVDALRRFSMQQPVREGTMRALEQPDFPLVQIALIDLMVETRDQQAVDALQRLSEDAKSNEAVRARAAWGVQQLKS
jgi:hypothetical protein